MTPSDGRRPPAGADDAPLRHARLLPTDPPLRVDAFLAADTPGNVGVALSGGGSRALAAGMGQLRALAALQRGGRSLLSQVKALCAVSGSAWLALPYTYLRGEVTDEDFLGPMVPPEALRPTRGPGVPADAALDQLRPGNIGQVPAHPRFSPAAWGLAVLEQAEHHGVPEQLLWQVLIARHVLSPYGLFQGWEQARGEPASLFSYDTETLARDVLAQNPDMAGTPAYLYADRMDAGRARRPFLICQGAALLADAADPTRLELAQVQFTPFFAGALGRPGGVDANGQPLGGGVVPPFAFAGVVQARSGPALTLAQPRPFSLADVAGISSALFSEAVRNSRWHLRSDPALRDAVKQRLGDGPAWLPGDRKDDLAARLDTAAAGWLASASASQGLRRLAQADLLVPSYCAVGPGAAVGGRARTTFADGGALDNSGITGLLAYADIDTILAFQNTFTPLAAAARGALDADGAELPDSRVRVSAQLPPLFGYQPYREGVGYRLYAGDAAPARAELAGLQVFESAAFAPLLRALRASSAGGAPAVACLRLRVLANRALGVRGRGGPGDDDPTPLTLMLRYTGRVRAFYDRLHPAVQALHGPFDDAASCDGFPCYPTGHIQLPAARVNLLAHLTAFAVAEPAQAAAIQALFGPDPPGPGPARGPRAAGPPDEAKAPAGWRVPTLLEAFALLARRPPRLVFLDTKLPPDDDAVARRMAAQYMDALRRHPVLRDRALVACPDAHRLAVMKAAFAATADFADFHGFALDHEELSDLFIGNDVNAAAPLRGAAGNRYLSIGAPYKPLAVGDFDDLLRLVRRTLAETRRPDSPHHGKPLCVWTIDEEPQLRALAALGPAFILTNRPALLHRVLDERYGPAGADPRRPAVMCHRGGPDGCGLPENTLPLIARGLQVGDAIEIDVCSAVDGAIVHHDNDPNDVLAVYRRSGGGVGEFRPTFQGEALRRMDQRTVAEIQASCGYARDEKGAAAEVKTVLDALAVTVEQAVT